MFSLILQYLRDIESELGRCHYGIVPLSVSSTMNLRGLDQALSSYRLRLILSDGITVEAAENAIKKHRPTGLSCVISKLNDNFELTFREVTA